MCIVDQCRFEVVQSVYSIEEEEAIQASLIASGSVSSVEELKVRQEESSFVVSLVLISAFQSLANGRWTAC